MVPMLRTIAYRVPLMLAIYKITNHNTDMTRELDPVQAEAYKRNPDWMTVAQRIAEQPGCEDFPIADVERILNKPGEITISTIKDDGESAFVIGAIIPDTENPFEAVVDKEMNIRLLRINSAVKDSSFGARMRAEREIAVWTEVNPSGPSTWMGAGIKSDRIILDSNAPRLDLTVGTDEVNAFFARLAERPDMQRVKPRIVGCLFQVARLALDFGAPTPTAPESLATELAQARDYYLIAQKRAEAIIRLKDALDLLSMDQGALPSPAIRYDRSLEISPLPVVRAAQKALNYPTRREAERAMTSCATVLLTLDALAK